MIEAIEKLRRQVVEYTLRHPELAEAHHYDFAIFKGSKADFFVFGSTPGKRPKIENFIWARVISISMIRIE
jgi:hypothetical protein